MNIALGNIPTISRTITDEQRNLTDTLLAATGLAQAGTVALGPAENDLIAAASGFGHRCKSPVTTLRNIAV